MKFSLLSCCMCGKTPETAVNTAKEIGSSAIDWVTLCGKTPGFLRKITLDAGLEIGTYTFILKDFPVGNWRDAAKREIDNAVALGASAVMLPTTEIAGICDRAQARRQWIGAVAETAALADDANIIFTIENYAGICSPCITFDDFLLFRKEIPGLQLTFDCGNAFTGEDPVESLRKSLRHIQNVHIKDWIVSGGTDLPGSCRVSEDTCFRMTLPLSGIVPVREIMAELGNAQYQKNIVMEYIYGDYPVSVQREMISQLKDIFHG